MWPHELVGLDGMLALQMDSEAVCLVGFGGDVLALQMDRQVLHVMGVVRMLMQGQGGC